MKLIVNIPELENAAPLIDDIENVIIAYMESLHTSDPDAFYHGLIPDCEDEFDERYEEMCHYMMNYDRYCKIAEDAVSAMRSGLYIAYQQAGLHNVMNRHELVGIKTIDRNTVVIEIL